MERVQRGAAVDARVQVARARADDEVEVDEPAGGDVELGHSSRGHAAVEDHGRVGAAHVGGEEVDYLVAARLLLRVAGHPHVHRQFPRCGQLRGGLDEHVELALVVRDPAPVEPAVPFLERERIGLPELERIRRLHVDVPVDEHRRRGSVRRLQVADDQRLRVGRNDLGLAAGAAHESGQPLRGRANVVRMRRVRAHARDPDQLGELVEPGLRHGARVYGTVSVCARG